VGGRAGEEGDMLSLSDYERTEGNWNRGNSGQEYGHNGRCLWFILDVEEDSTRARI
jgi:hypothetical protein